MIIQHPTKSGWLKSTPEVERLLNVQHQLVLPDGSQVHPLHFHPPDFTDSDVDAARAYALAYVRSIAAEKEDAIDALIAGNLVRAMMLNTEIVQYQNDGRPANPSAAVYALADALATRRGATLRDTLEALRTRWLSVRSRIATIITELDRVEDALGAAVDVGEIEAILAGLNYG